jgi:peptidylprolyl isomerase
MWGNFMAKVENGDKVKVHYTGKLDSGEVFDSSEGKDPLEFTAGEKQVIKGFDDAVVGMEKGEEKDIKIECAEAYGEPKQELVQSVPKEHLPANIEAKEGTSLLIQTPQGQKLPAKVVAVEKDIIKLDLNHPLAGKALNFKLKIEDIEKKS